MMKTKVIMLFFSLIGAILSCQTETRQHQSATKVDTAIDSIDLIQRGGYLVTLGGCGDCHSPKVMTPQGPTEDTTRLLSGYDSSRPFANFNKEIALSGTMVVFNIENTAFAGPWGVTYAANLTPDHSGLGGWTFDRFKKAMKEGKWKGMDNTRQLLPPMPWQNYRDVTDDDLEAMFAYLQSLKPINNPVPTPIHPKAL